MSRCLPLLFFLFVSVKAIALNDSDGSIPGTWTAADRAAWEYIRAGNSIELRLPGALNTIQSKSGYRTDRQKISGAFLRAILFDPTFVKQIPQTGVKISGAWINEALVIRDLVVPFPVSLENSLFDEPLDFSGTRFEKMISLNGSEFSKGLSCPLIHVSDNLDLRNTTVKGTADFTFANIGESFWLGGPNFDTINLAQVRIGRDLAVDGLVCKSILIPGASIGGMLLMKGSHFENVTLTQTTIGGNLQILGCKFDSQISPEEMVIGGSVFIGEDLTAPEKWSELPGLGFFKSKLHGDLVIRKITSSLNRATIRLNDVQIDRNFLLNDCNVHQVLFDLSKIDGICFLGNVKADYLHLLENRTGKALAIQDCEFQDAADIGAITTEYIVIIKTAFRRNLFIGASKVTSALQLAADSFSGDVILSGSKIEGSLSLGNGGKCDWSSNSSLDLRDTTVGTLSDDIHSWPSKIYLTNFSYSQWSGSADISLDLLGDLGDTKKLISSKQDQPFEERDASWFIDNWLGRDKKYAAQPYNQLASVLRNAGMETKAVQILYQGKEKEREESTGLSRVVSWLSMALIGYGYHYERSVYWCFGFVIVGFLVLKLSGESRKHRSQVDLGFFYSLDAFLPFVELRKKFGEVDFSGWVKYYFYFHRLAGYVIGSFIIAGLSGIAR